MRSSKIASDNCVVHVPFTLFPSPYPKHLYDTCLDIQPIINKLMLKMANDTSFLETSLENVIPVDEFTRNLLNIQQTVIKEGIAQPILSCINRSDYMLDRPVCKNDVQQPQELRMRQVEVNAIASALSTHSRGVTQMHNYLNKKYSWLNEKLPGVVEFPRNDSLKLIADSLIKAYDAYGNPSAIILLIMEDRSLNFSEHLQIELEICKTRPNIRLMRQRFADLPEAIELGPNKELLLKKSDEIAVVYFRFGYDPSNYNFDQAWQCRLTIERSRAIKCPSIGFHVSGIKKFQQLLHSQQQLERFLTSSEAQQLSRVLSQFWSLDAGSDEGELGYQYGLENYQSVVLKPQREGGGHNTYGRDIKQLLDQIRNSPERQQYILMELINSPREKNVLLHPDNPGQDPSSLKIEPLISELGIYGNILAEAQVELDNSAAGYLVRSKLAGVNEGGVVSGYAGISSVVLIDEVEADLSLFYNLGYDE